MCVENSWKYSEFSAFSLSLSTESRYFLFLYITQNYLFHTNFFLLIFSSPVCIFIFFVLYFFFVSFSLVSALRSFPSMLFVNVTATNGLSQKAHISSKKLIVVPTCLLVRFCMATVLHGEHLSLSLLIFRRPPTLPHSLSLFFFLSICSGTIRPWYPSPTLWYDVSIAQVRFREPNGK